MTDGDTLTPDVPSDAPVDGLDLVIESLDRVIPVFTDRLELGVNTAYCRHLAGALQSQAQTIAWTTQNTRRKQIIPAAPILSRLKDSALKAAVRVDSLHRQEWESEGPDAAGRRFLVGLSKGHLGELVNAITSLESQWGSFHIWIKRRAWAFCESLNRAWQKRELDSEELLVWFREHELGLLEPQLDPYIAQVVLGMHVSNGEILLPGDLRNLAHLNEHEITSAILDQARRRKQADEDTRGDRVRLTVGQNSAGRGIRRYAESLDAEGEQGMTLKERLSDVVGDPIEFLRSTRQPIKLVDLAAMPDEVTTDERWSHLRLTVNEYRYLKLRHGCEMTQQAAREYLGWDTLRFQAVRRSADLKLKKYRETGTAEDKRRIKKK
jgi:hypothetical protein